MASKDKDKTFKDKFAVTFTHVARYKGKTYRAAGVYLSFGGSPGIACIAMKAGKKKWVVPDSYAQSWLESRGLAAETAAALVADAAAERDAPKSN
jgi:hypothetical protein